MSRQRHQHHVLAQEDPEEVVINQPYRTTTTGLTGSGGETYVMTNIREPYQEGEASSTNSYYPSLTSTASGSLKNLSPPSPSMAYKALTEMRLIRKNENLERRHQLDLEQQKQEEDALNKRIEEKALNTTQYHEMMKFKSPKDECSPEDCCCLVYFLYLLFNPETKPAALDNSKSPMKMASKLIPGMKNTRFAKNTQQDRILSSGGPGYSYFKNISTGSSIDSKASWMGLARRDDGIEMTEPNVGVLVEPVESKDPSDNDDNESDGWLGGNKDDDNNMGHDAADLDSVAKVLERQNLSCQPSAPPVPSKSQRAPPPTPSSPSPATTGVTSRSGSKLESIID